MSRGHVELVHAPQISPSEIPAAGWPAGARARVLSRDPGTGALTAVVELPAGWRRPPGHLAAEWEWMVLAGSVRIGERMRGFGWYDYVPAGADIEAWATDTGCTLLLFAHDQAPDFMPRRGGGNAAVCVALDTETMPWIESPVPGPPGGILLKLLRSVPETGEMLFLCTNVPHYDYPVLEFHDCIEEIYMIEGDIWLGNSGLMTAGSYFWRPPFITHGPFYSETGALMIAWVPSTLVNHVPLSAASTPEENLARFIASGGERVMAGTSPAIVNAATG